MTVLVDVETHILAEFVERPGLGDLDMLGDLAYFLSAIGSAETIDTFDRNAITYDEDLERVYTGNGIPDAAELFLLQEVLLRPGLDLSHRGGVVHYFAWPAWTANVARAAVDLPGLDARIQRVVAGYMTIGDWATVESMRDMVSAHYSVDLDPADYDRSRQRYLSAKNSADNDGLSNLEEWQIASPDGSLAYLPEFVNAALDGVKAANAPQAPPPANCPNETCVPKVEVLAPTAGKWFGDTFLPGTATISEVGHVRAGTIVRVSAPETHENSRFLWWWSVGGTPLTMVQMSRDNEDEFMVMGPGPIQLAAVYSGGVGIKVPEDNALYSITVSGGEDGGEGGPGYRTFLASTPGAPITLSAKRHEDGAAAVNWVHKSHPDAWDPKGSSVPTLVAFANGYVYPGFPGGGPGSAEHFVFTARSTPGGTGMVSQNSGHGGGFPGSARVIENSQVTFAALIEPGYEFDGWETPFAGYGPTITMSVSQATPNAATARTKEKVEYTLTLELAGDDPICAGHIKVNETTGSGRLKYYGSGNSVSLQALANPGYFFAGWEGNAKTSDGTPISQVASSSVGIRINENTEVIAKFTEVNAELQSVIFGGTRYQTMYKKDPGMTWNPSAENFEGLTPHPDYKPYEYALPAEAYVVAGGQSLPVCYPMGAFGQEFRTQLRLKHNGPTPAYIEGRRNGAIVFRTDSAFSLVGHDETISPQFDLLTPITDSVGQESMTISWHIRFCESQPWMDLGTSQNLVFRVLPMGVQNVVGYVTQPNAKRVDFLTQAASGTRKQRDAADAVAEAIKSIVTQLGGPLTWHALDTGVGDCEGSRTVAAYGLLILGVPLHDLRFDCITECHSWLSTDNTTGPNYNSDCTDRECPNTAIAGDVGDPNFDSTVPGIPCTTGADCGGGVAPNQLWWVSATSPAENFFKVYEPTDGTWYYIAVFPYVPSTPGSIVLGSAEDLAGRYQILKQAMGSGQQTWGPGGPAAPTLP